MARKITNVGLHQIGKMGFHLVNTNNTNNKHIAKEKVEAARLDILAKVTHHKDKKTPTRKGDLVLRLTEWEARRALSVDEEVAIVVVNTRSELH